MVDTSDLLLVLGALVIFALVTLNINTMLATNTANLTTNELDYEGVAVGQNVIDEARVLAFDESCTNGNSPSNIPQDFSNSSNFGGASEGEAYPHFDDFDDYNGYSRTDTTTHGVYTISARVMYVETANPETNAGHKTRNKRMNVTVTSPYLDHDITLYFIRSYY